MHRARDESGKYTHGTVLEQAVPQLMSVAARRFRQAPNQPHVAFEVIFADEHVIGSAGPYRAFFADVCADLTTALPSASGATASACEPLLPLLVPCPNGAMQHGENRDQLLLRPLSKHPDPALALLKVGRRPCCRALWSL